MSQNNNFTIDTYFLITIVGGVIWIILRKFWDAYMNQRRHRRTIKTLEHIPKIIENVDQILSNVQSIKLASERINPLSISVDLE